MKSLRLILAFPLVCSLSGALVTASEEEYLEYGEIRVVSPERKDTGKVVFAAKADREKILSVNIEAFGKKYVLSDGELEKVTGFPISSLVITHEAGFELTGGHTVHFKLKKVGYKDEKLTEEKALISVSQKKGLDVRRLEPHIVEKVPVGKL